MRLPFPRSVNPLYPQPVVQELGILASVKVSVSSPVAILVTLTALLTTSAGRFSPLGPLGIVIPGLPLRDYAVEISYF